MRAVRQDRMCSRERASARLAEASSQRHGVTRGAVGRSAACCVLTLLLCSTCAASVIEGHDLRPEEQCLPPWEFSQADSSLLDVPPSVPAAVGPERLLFSLLMRTYKSAISPVGGRRCGMHPNCSSYAQDAIKNLGTGIGVTMACDRLLRCGNDPHFYHLVRDDGRVLRNDPVDNACRDSE